MKNINYIFIVLFTLIRPLLGPSCCKYSLSCGNFAIQQLKEQNLFVALWIVIKRLLSCI